MKQIISALLKAQKEMQNAKKDASNPFFKSKYADLNSVREAGMPLLNDNNILVLQPMVTIDGNEYVKTILLHESGETIESFTKIICKSQNDPQAYGSGVTYARRYGLQSLLSMGADDDDGKQAEKQPKQNLEDAIYSFGKVYDRTSFESCMTKFSVFMKNEKIVSICTDLAVKFPKPTK